MNLRHSSLALWLAFAFVALGSVSGSTGRAYAQGVTTGTISGLVTNAQSQPVAGASVIAIHEPSGTSYETTTRADGRYAIPNMRVGGPYTLQVVFTGAGGAAFAPQTKEGITVNLGISSDVNVIVQAITVSEEVTVSGQSDPVFSSNRTGAATQVSRDEIANLPTLSGRIGDVTRLSPQAGASGTFAGQDNRMNNMTVDGSTFNSGFGLSGEVGGRTGVAPISLEAIEQIQVSVAPFDVRQGSFVGAGVNTVTRSGANKVAGAFYHRFRDQDWVGTEAKGQTVNPGTFTFRNTGGFGSGPIVKNKWFAFGNYEDEKDERPLSTFRANRGEAVAGQITRVSASDMTALSSFLGSKFGYETGPFEDVPDQTPAKRFLIRSDYNLNNTNKITFRYTQLDSFTDVYMSSSGSALRGRSGNSATSMNFQNSDYKILENMKSGIGEWNTVLGNNMANTFQTGYTYQDESRDARGKMFPFVDIFEAGTSYSSFGFEPFTVNNELRYGTFQIQDNLTKFTDKHSFTFGTFAEKYHSDNVFFGCCPQGAWQYNSQTDFYADANDALANPNRTVSPVTAGRFQIRWVNLPGLDKPLQPLDVWYGAGYAQDEWRPRRNVTLTAGVRADITKFKNTAYRNAAADALTFRDETGSPVKYDTGRMPDTQILWSPRVGINWDVTGDQKTQVRGGTGLFTGRPPYVWISNQIGNTGVLIGERIVDNTTAFPFTTDVKKYQGTPTGAGASSYALNVTDPDFKFPQVWRSNIALDHRLPKGIVSTTEFLYANDVNGVYYINSNLPAAQGAFNGVDNRMRWVGVACAANGQAGGCVNRINNDTGNQVTVNYVLKNGNEGSSSNFSQSLSKTTTFGLSLRGAYSYGVSRTLVDPESTAATSFQRVSTFGDPNNSGVSYSMWSPGHRVFVLGSYSHEYFKFGATSVSVFWEAREAQASSTPSSRFSYIYGGDLNGDGVTNDLIYIPKDASEMNFSAFTTTTGITYSADQQAAAFEAFIKQDSYLKEHRGEYAKRNAGVMPMFNRADMSISQDFFKNVHDQRNAFQLRLDIFNLGNLLNSGWGVSWQQVASTNTNNQVQILTNPAVDAQGRATYRLATLNNQLITNSVSRSAFTGDVYQWMLSLRYSFN
ncbi:MAG: carboxypeptidase regulatory-like domain-containing protein [Vicinamibacterales bacterium]|nr:carboxypeptidase regulatory-like domain-containing protein [Vicinamibacterales bacterium]